MGSTSRRSGSKTSKSRIKAHKSLTGSFLATLLSKSVQPHSSSLPPIRNKLRATPTCIEFKLGMFLRDRRLTSMVLVAPRRTLQLLSMSRLARKVSVRPSQESTSMLFTASTSLKVLRSCSPSSITALNLIFLI